MLDSLGEERDYRLLTERWENRIVFTTMVQFLNTFYGKEREICEECSSVECSVIFDEIRQFLSNVWLYLTGQLFFESGGEYHNDFMYGNTARFQ